MRRLTQITFIIVGLVTLPVALKAQDAALREAAVKGLHKATKFFREQVSVEGSYVWRYSEDLSRREGEEKTTTKQAWIQTPGTPAVGMAYLSAYEVSGDAEMLAAAKETAYSLVKGQLRSGGWDNMMEFDPAERKKHSYRVEPGTEKGRNVTTLDDDKTQSALRFMMRIDQTLHFKDAKIHEATEFALASLVAAQYPNGAWPQRFNGPPDPAKFPVKKASYPETWSRTYPGVDYKSHYTLNDSTISDTIDTMLLAAEIYNEPKYKAAAEKGGSFFILAQMPDPQPAWAQQYDADMHPAWARKFEPPSITGGESQAAMKTLLTLYRETGDKKFLEPIPRALDWFRRARLPEGRFARFNELQTNKPLYFTKDYVLTYSDADMPTHYAFKVSDGIEKIAADFEKARTADPAKLKPSRKPPEKPKLTSGLTEQTKTVLAAMDDQGRWIIDGKLNSDASVKRIIDTRTFIRNIAVLNSYIAASNP